MDALALLSLGFGLGLVHALDADHVMAVSALASQKPGARRPWRIALDWSLGHSGCLLLVACVALPLGLVLPPALSHGAEVMVGLSMIALAIWVGKDLLGRGAHIHFHRHDGIPRHAHWHVHDSEMAQAEHRHSHAPVLMGALHGLAGSAPIFALIPAVESATPLVAVAYLGVFGAGVLTAMLAFGGVLGQVLKRFAASHHPLGSGVLRAAVAAGSLSVGVAILLQKI